MGLNEKEYEERHFGFIETIQNIVHQCHSVVQNQFLNT